MTGVPLGARRWQVGHGRTIELGPRSCIMGILNVTPDSFSDGGRFLQVDAALLQASRMLADGATIIDVGGESTRPGAQTVDAIEEQRRVIPVIEALAPTGCLLSIDTYRASTAQLAVRAGAHVVNDVQGLQRDPAMARVAAESGSGLCIMHTGRERATLADPVEDQFAFLRTSLRIAAQAGVADDRIVLDPGFGFAKDADHNLQLMARFAELAALGFPLLAGTSRKRFVRALVGEGNVDVATAATCVLLRERGASIFRVHDVVTSRDSLAVADAVLAISAGLR